VCGAATMVPQATIILGFLLGLKMTHKAGQREYVCLSEMSRHSTVDSNLHFSVTPLGLLEFCISL
jgi:hypothetical protein